MFPSKIPGCHEIKVVLLEGKGSVLLALEGACRKRSVQMESLRSGEVALLAANCWHRQIEQKAVGSQAFSWPSWTPEQVLSEG